LFFIANDHAERDRLSATGTHRIPSAEKNEKPRASVAISRNRRADEADVRHRLKKGTKTKEMDDRGLKAEGRSFAPSWPHSVDGRFAAQERKKFFLFESRGGQPK
jgi:hypothetical protein